MVEILVFLLIVAVIVGACASVIYLLGMSFAFSFQNSLAVAFISVWLFVPAFFMFREAIKAPYGESKPERILTGVGTIGMLIVGVVFCMPFFSIEMTKAFFFGGAILGALMWWGSMPFIHHFENKRRLFPSDQIPGPSRAPAPYLEEANAEIVGHTTHIHLCQGAAGVYVDVDDYELMDFVQDLLVEEHNIEYENLQGLKNNGREIYRIHISENYSFDQVKSAIFSVPTEEIERIWYINK